MGKQPWVSNSENLFPPKGAKREQLPKPRELWENWLTEHGGFIEESSHCQHVAWQGGSGGDNGLNCFIFLSLLSVSHWLNPTRGQKTSLPIGCSPLELSPGPQTQWLKTEGRSGSANREWPALVTILQELKYLISWLCSHFPELYTLGKGIMLHNGVPCLPGKMNQQLLAKITNSSLSCLSPCFVCFRK